MDVGMMMIFSSYGWEEGSDGQMWEEELRLGEIAADAGFDCLWSAEHHFKRLFLRAGQYPRDDPSGSEASGYRRGNSRGDSSMA